MFDGNDEGESDGIELGISDDSIGGKGVGEGGTSEGADNGALDGAVDGRSEDWTSDAAGGSASDALASSPTKGV